MDKVIIGSHTLHLTGPVRIVGARGTGITLPPGCTVYVEGAGDLGEDLWDCDPSGEIAQSATPTAPECLVPRDGHVRVRHVLSKDHPTGAAEVGGIPLSLEWATWRYFTDGDGGPGARVVGDDT